MYPHVALNIQNHKPHITFHPEEGMSRQMTMADVDLSNIIEKLARELDLIDDMLEELTEREMFVENLLEIARNAADTTKVEQYPELNTENVEFELDDALAGLVAQAKKNREQYEEIAELEPDVKQELLKNENQDIFASTLEAMYNTLIANTLLAASEIGVGKIKLNDEHKNTRLQEKMAQELEKLGMELIVE